MAEVKETTEAEYDEMMKKHEHGAKSFLQKQVFTVVKLPKDEYLEKHCQGSADKFPQTVKLTVSGKNGIGVLDSEYKKIKGFEIPTSDEWHWHDIEYAFGHERVAEGLDDVRHLNKHVKRTLEDHVGSVEIVIQKKHDSKHSRFYLGCEDPKKVIAALRSWQVNARLQTGGIPHAAPHKLCDKVELSLMVVQRLPEELCEVINWPSLLYMTFAEGGIQMCCAETGDVSCWVKYSAITDHNAIRGDEENICDSLTLSVKNCDTSLCLESKHAPLFKKALQLALKDLSVEEEEEEDRTDSEAEDSGAEFSDAESDTWSDAGGQRILV